VNPSGVRLLLRLQSSVWLSTLHVDLGIILGSADGGGVCSVLVLSARCRTEPVEEDAKTNLLCHPLERVLCAATRHVTLPDAPCLPAARLLTAWPATPVPTDMLDIQRSRQHSP
jgi:hypothetical protein